MADGTKATTAQTLTLLEDRLRYLDFVLNGHTAGEEAPKKDDNQNATARLRTLEKTLSNLAVKSPAASAVLSLHDEHPVVFHGSQTSEGKPALSTDALAAMIIAHTTLFNQTSTNLNSLKDISIPNSSDFAKIVNLQAKIQELTTKQEAQAADFASLRARSATLVEQWYEGGVLDMGDEQAFLTSYLYHYALRPGLSAKRVHS